MALTSEQRDRYARVLWASRPCNKVDVFGNYVVKQRWENLKLDEFKRELISDSTAVAEAVRAESRNELVYALLADYEHNREEIGIQGIEYWLTGYLHVPTLEGGES